MSKKISAGKKSRIDPSELQNVLFNYGLKLFNNEELNYNSNIWSEISEKFNKSMKPSSIYLTVSQNQHQLLTNLRKHLGLNYVDNKIISSLEMNDDFSNYCVPSDTDDYSDKEIESDTTEESKKKKNVETFELEIPYKIYRKMKPVSVEYRSGNKKRRYSTLKQGVWTNLIFDQFWNKYKMPCNYAFKRCKIYDSHNAKYFLTVKATCVDPKCKSDFIGVSENKPLEDEPLKLKIFTKNTANSYDHSHNKKRQLNGYKRSKIGHQLQTTYAYIWQRDEVNKKCKFGDKMPPNVYNTDVLRKAKQTYMDCKIGIENKDVIQSIVQLKHIMPYAGSIHLISADPFMVHYWTPQQLVIYKEAFKIDKKTCRICTDATGSLVKKIVRTPEKIKSAHIFLYIAVLNDGNIQVPICQMLSEAQDMSTIVYRLSQWIRCGAPTPYGIVTDYSNALIGAVIRSFVNGMTKNLYCNASLHKLQNDQAPLPSVFIRLDISHFTKMICRWKCLRRNKLKEFFVRCLLLLSQCESLAVFETIFVKLLVVACSETDGMIVNSNIKTPAEIFRYDLVCLIKDHNILYNETDEITQECIDNANNINEDNCIDNESNDRLSIFLKNLSNQIDKSSVIDGDRLNAYYVPELRRNVFRIAKDFPLWSNVMLPNYNSIFKTASSAPAEGSISDIKRQFKCKPLTADRFVASHLQAIEGNMKVSRNQQLELYDQYEEYQIKNNNYVSEDKQSYIIIDEENFSGSENENDSLINNNNKHCNLMDISTSSAACKLDEFENENEDEDSNESINLFAQNDLLELENWKNKANNLNVKKKEFSSTKIVALIFKEY